MKVALVGLPNDFLVNRLSVPRMGLLYLGAVLKNHDVEIFCLDKLSDCQAICEGNFDFVGISATTIEYPDAVAVLNYFKRVGSPAEIIIGGPHVNALPDEAVRNGFDLVIKGEAETVIDQAIELKMHGLIDAGYVGDLNRLPLPMRSLTEKYNWQPNLTGEMRNRKSASILLSRGCPFNCTFCGPHYPYRHRSNESIFTELRDLRVQDYEDLIVLDDLPFVAMPQVTDFCQMAKSFNLNFRCNMRADLIDQHVAEILVGGGCIRVQIGIESVSDTVLSLVDKKTSTNQNVKAILDCHNVGLKVKVMLIWGFPGDTAEMAHRMVDWVEIVRPDFLQISRFTPLPLSPIWAQCQGGVVDYKELNFFPIGRNASLDDIVYSQLVSDCAQLVEVDDGSVKARLQDVRL